MSIAAEAVLIVAAGVGAAGAVLALPRPPAREAPAEQWRPPATPRDPRPAQLVRLERIVEWSSRSGSAVEASLQPILAEIAETRLARRSVRLDRDGEDAERLLGPAAWELLRPDRPAAEGAIDQRRLAEVVAALEAL